MLPTKLNLWREKFSNLLDDSENEMPNTIPHPMTTVRTDILITNYEDEVRIGIVCLNKRREPMVYQLNFLKMTVKNWQCAFISASGQNIRALFIQSAPTV